MRDETFSTTRQPRLHKIVDGGALRSFLMAPSATCGTRSSSAPERRPFAFSTETRDGVNFTIEARAHVDPTAESTVLKWVLSRDAKGTLYGNDVTLLMHPYCSRDLKVCRLGVVAGIADGSTFPTYWLSSEEVFSLAPKL